MALRHYNPDYVSKAKYFQGQIDGATYITLNLLDACLKENPSNNEEEPPTY